MMGRYKDILRGQKREGINRDGLPSSQSREAGVWIPKGGLSSQQVLHKHSSVQLEICNPLPDDLVLLAL